MQQSCTYGSVRGAMGDHRPYRDESLAPHRVGRGAPPARRDDREYREYLSEEQRSPGVPNAAAALGWSRRGCIARRMQPDFHHGLQGGGRIRRP